MKKSFVLMAAAALLIAMPSCKKDPKKPDEGTKPQEEVARVLETFENGGILGWTGSDGAQFRIVDNPKKSGINTSDKVGEYTTAANQWDFVWTSGFGDTEKTFEDSNYIPLDFSKEGYIIKVQCLAPAAGMPIYCKLEGMGVGQIENKSVKTTKANEWEELEFDFEPLGVVDGKYKNFVFCVDAGGETAGTIVYLDNVRQVKGE